jgi:pyruvate dehydrogenase E2 component (dihydrolipoyllysine-residue acetyltransferase)
MVEITIPSVGIAMEEALVVKWFKQPGDSVAVDEPIVEIETDKASMDIVSPVAGTLGAHLVEPGSVVAVGATIVHVLDGKEESASAVELTPLPAGEDGRDDEPSPAEPESEADGEERAAHRLSPRARRLAREREQKPPAPAPDGNRFRELIAAKVSESWREIPHFTVSREVDAEPMQALLARVRADGVAPAPTLSDLLLRALALALLESGVEGPVDVGLAVATANGVVIPVVADVLALGPNELAVARSRAVERARAGKLSEGDLSSRPRSTLSNLGAFGVDRFTGIVALGQTSLLTVGRAVPRVVADERRAITVKTMFDATLNADHRSVDGADAARLLVAFVAAVESMTPDPWERRA